MQLKKKPAVLVNLLLLDNLLQELVVCDVPTRRHHGTIVHLNKCWCK
jgi:hypothetical protein